MSIIFDPSLVLFLPLYDSDGVSAMSRDAYGRLSTVTGAVWTQSGRYFDGADDFIQVPHGGSLAPAQITVETWVRVTGAGTANDFNALVSKGVALASPTRSWELGWVAADVLGDQRIIFNFSTTGSNWEDVHKTMVMPLHTDVHIVATYDKFKAVLYLNGIMQAVTAYPGSIYASTRSVNVGRSPVGGYFTKGTFGEVRIYNRALTPMEVQNNYLATKWRYR